MDGRNVEEWRVDERLDALRGWPGDMIETHRSFCRFCHAVCGIEVDVEDGRAIAVRGDRDHVVSQGYLCVKGRELIEQHTHPSRLRGAKHRMSDATS
jgi:anaerobic selenocysteine-containing dehydrogenase